MRQAVLSGCLSQTVPAEKPCMQAVPRRNRYTKSNPVVNKKQWCSLYVFRNIVTLHAYREHCSPSSILPKWRICS